MKSIYSIRISVNPAKRISNVLKLESEDGSVADSSGNVVVICVVVIIALIWCLNTV